MASIMPPICIQPGRTEWEAFIGGDFFPAEEDADGTYRWLGAGPGWIYLPEIPVDPEANLSIQLDLSCNAWGPGNLVLIHVPTTGTASPYRRAIASSAPDFQGQSTIHDVLPHAISGSISYQIVPAPGLLLTADNGPLGNLQIQSHHGLQSASINLPAKSLQQTKALRLTPNFAFRPSDFGHPETRLLSFRLHRIAITQAIP